MVRPSLAPIPARSRLPVVRLLAPALAVVLLMPALVRADTVMVVGVVVDSRQQRVGGALVRLYTTSTKMGSALAQDRSSPHGVFRLYRTNISGDLGDLYVVYEGDTGTAEPLRVSLQPVDGGLTEARTPDIVVLTVTVERNLSKREAAARVEAIAKTQAILVQAGVRDAKTANEAVKLRTREVIAAVPNFDQKDAEVFERNTIDKLKVLPFGTADVSKGVHVAMEPAKRIPGKGVS
jgi:hypothetical protein